MKKKIYFRADASADIGYGHFIRTLALADILKDRFDCVFYTISPSKYQVNELNKVCRYVVLDNNNFKSDFLEYLRGGEIVVLDNYYYNTDYQKTIKKKGCSLVCIDDMHDKTYSCDVVINHGFSDKSLFKCSNETLLCLGNNWALLRKSFLNNKSKLRTNTEKSLRILIMFGGSDKYNLSEKIAEYIADIDSVNTIMIVSGDAHIPIKVLSQKIKFKQNLSADEIVELMNNSDVAIMSSSSVCLEAKACGLPIIAGYYVENQKGVYEEYKKNKDIYPVGYLLEKSSIQNISKAIRNLLFFPKPITLDIIDNYNILFEWLSLKSFHTDSYYFKNYTELSPEESFEIWKMRNSDSIRKCMDHKEIFTLKSHYNFIDNLSHDYLRIFWAVIKDEIICGSINISFYSENVIERGIFINPNLIGSGIAKSIERELYNIFSSYSIKEIVAYVLKDNSHSYNYHLKLGYKLVNKNESHYNLKFEL